MNKIKAMVDILSNLEATWIGLERKDTWHNEKGNTEELESTSLGLKNLGRLISTTKNTLNKTILRISRLEEERLRRLALETTMLDGLLDFSGKALIASQIKNVSDKFERKALNMLYRVYREREILEILKSKNVGWNKVLREVVGRGLDERVIEIPLAMEAAQIDICGKVLDAGSALNLGYIKRNSDNVQAKVVHYTQTSAREAKAFERDSYSFMFGDLRDTCFKDNYFDRIVCISTLEHIGMDNSRYGASEKEVSSIEGTKTKPISAIRVLEEMQRVLAKGGEMLVTVPYGQQEDRNWYQVFNRECIDAMVNALAECQVGTKYYHYVNGWKQGSIEIPKERLYDAGRVTSIAAIKAIKG